MTTVIAYWIVIIVHSIIVSDVAKPASSRVQRYPFSGSERGTPANKRRVDQVVFDGVKRAYRNRGRLSNPPMGLNFMEGAWQ
jgi:hypothetical protein